MNHTVTLLMSQFVTHDVKHFIISKPQGFSVTPGQGVELAINLPGVSEQGRPFTPTGLAADRVLEFTIKAYPDHAGVTPFSGHSARFGAQGRTGPAEPDFLQQGTA